MANPKQTEDIGMILKAHEKRLAKLEAPPLPNLPWKMRAYLTADQAGVASGVATVVKLDNVTPPTGFDSFGAFSLANNWYSIPVAGAYLVVAHVSVNVNIVLTTFYLQAIIYINGVPHSGTGWSNGPTNGTLNEAIYDMETVDALQLNAGDHIQLALTQANNSVAALAARGGTDNCFLALHLLSVTI